MNMIGEFLAAFAGQLRQPTLAFLIGGIAIRQSDPADLILPALAAVAIGAGIVLIGLATLARVPGLRREDALATAGLSACAPRTTASGTGPWLRSALRSPRRRPDRSGHTCAA